MPIATISGNQNVATSPSYTATNGIRLVAFNGGNATPNGSLSQTFATFPGQSYTLLFDMGVIAYNLFEQRLQIHDHAVADDARHASVQDTGGSSCD